MPRWRCWRCVAATRSVQQVRDVDAEERAQRLPVGDGAQVTAPSRSAYGRAADGAAAFGQREEVGGAAVGGGERRAVEPQVPGVAGLLVVTVVVQLVTGVAEGEVVAQGGVAGDEPRVAVVVRRVVLEGDAVTRVVVEALRLVTEGDVVPKHGVAVPQPAAGLEAVAVAALEAVVEAHAVLDERAVAAPGVDPVVGVAESRAVVD